MEGKNIPGDVFVSEPKAGQRLSILEKLGVGEAEEDASGRFSPGHRASPTVLSLSGAQTWGKEFSQVQQTLTSPPTPACLALLGAEGLEM